MNRTALLVSAVLTAFVLVVVAGLAGRATAAPAAAAAAPQSRAEPGLAAANDGAPANDPAPEAALNAEIDARTAGQLALQAAPGAKLLRTPELVNLEGRRAYAVELDQGTMYIDAATGVVLYDGRPALAIGNHRGGDDHDAHEQHEADEHEHGDDD